MGQRGVRREDFREVKPTPEELTDWRKRYPSRSPIYRAEHRPCGTRIWYSGIAVAAHTRSDACRRARDARV